MEEKKQEGTKIWDALPGFEFDEEIDLSELHSFFYSGQHSIPRLTTMGSWFFNRYASYGIQYAAEKQSLPKYKGFCERDFNGMSYVALRIVRDEGEIEKRTVKFQEALEPWIEDFDGIWNGYKNELTTIYDRLKSFDVDKASNIDLLKHLWDLISMYRRMWEIHFLGMNVSFSAIVFLEQAVEGFGLTSQSPEFQNLFRGFDNKAFQVDRELWKLGRKAIDNRLSDVIMNNSPNEVLGKLEESDAGKEWLKSLQDFLEVDGWRMVRLIDLNEPYWLEDPSTVIAPIRGFIKKGGEFNLDEVRVKLSEDREKAKAELIAKVPDDKKEWFEALIELGSKASIYSEEHDLYCELSAHALLRRGLMAMGRRLAQAGTIDNPDDILFLNPDEVERVLPSPEFHKMQHITNRRRSYWEANKYEVGPMVYTDRTNLEEAVGMDLIPSADPIMIKIIVGEMPNVRPELKADMFGACGAPGVAEGPARVIMDYHQLEEVEKGDILVCPGTNPAWSSAFGLVNAIVTDRGGTLSHAAIVGREYGLPTLINTLEATSKIKTGQRIKVDATQGALYFLDE
jgi:pyruvate,water dikinase